MDKPTLIEKAKDLIAEGNTDKAIEQIEEFLAGKPNYKFLHTEALHIASLYYKTKQDEAKRTISFENAELNYGKTRQGLFNLLEHIENDRFNPEGLQSAKPTWKQALIANKWLLIIGLPLLLVAIAVVVLVNKVKEVNPAECLVEFDNESDKRFLVLPFFNPDGGELKPEGLIVERLESFCAAIESLKKSDFEICATYQPNRLLNYIDAAKRGEENMATIVIWGRAERSGNETVIKTRFKYLGGKDVDGKVPFTRLNQEGEQEVSTDKVLSIITSSGELTQDIETTLKLMVGMIANLEGDSEGAIQAMHAAAVTDSAANLLKYMILADNFIALNEPEKAEAALDTCLVVNPNYWLGRDNRATLRMESGNYLGAIDDFTVALKKQPDDTKLWVARGRAYKQSQQLYEAKKDFETAIRVKPAIEPKLRTEIKETNIEIKRLETIIEPGKANFDSRKMTKLQYVDAAQATNKLGDIATSKKLTAKGLDMDRDNPRLIAIQVDNFLKEKDLATAKRILKAALGRNVKKEEIVKHSANVAELLREMQSKKELEIQ